MTLLLVIHMMTYECLYDGDDDDYIYESIYKTYKSFVVVVMMMMTYEWLGDYSNDDSDYHDMTHHLP